ncbi:MAG: hypothetical protein AAGG48_13240 [Planctomycetota bacterium]
MLPSPEWCRALDLILSQAEREAASRNFPFAIERSSTSEARYLHVLRQDAWYGIRVASHFPKYACSRDYFQVLLEEPPCGVSIAYACRQISDLVRHGGSVVGCPDEIQTEIERRRARFVDDLEGRFTHRDAAVIRHQMNQRAKWTWTFFDQADT